MADVSKLDKGEIVKNIVDGRRQFTFEEGDNITHYYIADPSGEDIRKADWNYAKVFNNALADGFPTQAQMMDILTERGILSEEYTRKLEKIKIDLAAALFRLENMQDEMDDEAREDLALETARLRDEFFRLNQKINGPMGNTCENLAEEARNEYITSRVIQKQDGSSLWPTYDKYLSEDNNSLVLKCRFEVMAWLNGMDSNFIEKMPEQAALRQIAEKRLQDTLDRINQTKEEQSETGEKEVEDLSLPDKKLDKSKAKRGRPKKKKAPEKK